MYDLYIIAYLGKINDSNPCIFVCLLLIVGINYVFLLDRCRIPYLRIQAPTYHIFPRSSINIKLNSKKSFPTDIIFHKKSIHDWNLYTQILNKSSQSYLHSFHCQCLISKNTFHKVLSTI